MRNNKDKSQRIRIVDEILNGHRSFVSGARILGLCEQQMRNIVAKAVRDGIDSVAVDGRRNNRSSRSVPEATRQKIVDLCRDRYTDFNFAHYSSMLRDMEHISISDSSVERILKEAGFKVPKAKRRPAAHSRREPGAHAGELGQADASKHNWFQEGIDPATDNPFYHHLYGIIDDATGKVSALWMEKEETTHGYWQLMRLTNDACAPGLLEAGRARSNVPTRIIIRNPRTSTVAGLSGFPFYFFHLSKYYFKQHTLFNSRPHMKG